MQKPRVIFLCTANSSRSQMAEGLLRAYAGDTFDVYSAGLEPKGVNPFAREVMRDIDIDISGHTSNSVRDYLGHLVFTYVVTVCHEAEEDCPTAFLHQGQHLKWHFEDPAAFEGSYEDKRAKFAEVRDRIQERIRGWLSEMGIAMQVR